MGGKEEKSGPRESRNEFDLVRSDSRFSGLAIASVAISLDKLALLRPITSLIKAPKCAEFSLWTRDARSDRRVHPCRSAKCVRACVHVLLASKRRQRRSGRQDCERRCGSSEARWSLQFQRFRFEPSIARIRARMWQARETRGDQSRSSSLPRSSCVTSDFIRLRVIHVGTRTLTIQREIPRISPRISLPIIVIDTLGAMTTMFDVSRARAKRTRKERRLEEGRGGDRGYPFPSFPTYETGKTIGSGGSGADTRGSRASSAREGLRLPRSSGSREGGGGGGGEPDF